VRAWLASHPRWTCFVEENNAHPKSFVWTADPDRVLATVGKQTLESIH
jgi:hypothetical protein